MPEYTSKHGTWVKKEEVKTEHPVSKSKKTTKKKKK